MKKLHFIVIGLLTVVLSTTAVNAATSSVSPAAATPQAAASQQKIGIVNFRQCVEQSKVGQQEQESFDNMRKQLEATVQEKEKKLTELTNKFSDPNYVDSLSPEAEEEAKKEYRTLSQEMAQMQNQYYQMLNQANVKIIQKLAEIISQASEVVAKDKQLDVILNQDGTFFFNSTLEVTKDVVKAMDTIFASRPKQDATQMNDANATPAAPAAPQTKDAQMKKEMPKSPVNNK